MTDPDTPSPMARQPFNRVAHIDAILKARHAAHPEEYPFMAVPPEMATFTPILGDYVRFSVAYLARNHARDLGRTEWVVLRVAPDGRNLGRQNC